MNRDFTALIIMDGFGLAAPSPGNAISEQTAPNIFRLMREYPFTQLGASGHSVGSARLPDGQFGSRAS